MAIPYEFLLRGKENGAYSGAHVIDVAGGKARGIKVGDWPVLLGVLNDRLIARVDEVEAEAVALKAEHEAEIDTLKADKEAELKTQAEAYAALQAEMGAYKAQGRQAAQAVVAVVDNVDIDAEQTAATCKAIALQVLIPDRERKRLAALANLAAAQAEADSFN